MAARSPTRFPTRSPISIRRTPNVNLGKGGSQLTIPRLTGKGAIKAGELNYFYPKRISN